jgi:hypothetical protein
MEINNCCYTPASKPPTPQNFPSVLALTGVDLGFLNTRNNVEVINNAPFYSKTLVSTANAGGKQLFERTIDLSFKPYLTIIDIWLGLALRIGWQVTAIFGDEHCVRKSTFEHDNFDIFELFSMPTEKRQKFIYESQSYTLRLIFTKEEGSNVGLVEEEMALIQCQSLFKPQRAFQKKRTLKEGAPLILPKGEFLITNYYWDNGDPAWILAQGDSLMDYLTPRVTLGEKETLFWEKDSVIINFERLILPDTKSILLFQAQPVMFSGICAKISHQSGPDQIVNLLVETQTDIAMTISYETPTWFKETVTIKLNTLTDWIDTPMIIL